MMEKLQRNRPNINALRLSAMHSRARLDGNEDVSNIMSGEETHGCCGSSNNLQAIFYETDDAEAMRLDRDSSYTSSIR